MRSTPSCRRRPAAVRPARLVLASIVVVAVAGARAGVARAAEAVPGPSVDVVVYGATPAGIAAAVAAARLGRSVVLIEPTAHVGGIVASGLTNVDIIKKNAVAGIYAEFVDSVREHYASTYGKDSKQYKECRDGYHFEPKVAERLFLRLLEKEAPRVTLLYRRRLAKAIVRDGHLTATVLEDTGPGGGQITVEGRVFVDATYEGDLAAAAGVPYRVGREGREEFGEMHAGVIYARFGKDEFLPGSTGKGDGAIQGFCFRFMLTSVPENRAPVRKPVTYNRDDYRHLLADLKGGKLMSVRQAVQFWPLPNDRFEINSNHPDPTTGVPSESLDLAEENWAWPEADFAVRRKIFDRIWAYQEGLIWFLQHDREVPEKVREEIAPFGFCRDEFTDNDNRPWQVYVRQGRRIEGEYRLTENDGTLDKALARTAVQPTSIAVAEYPFDSHGCHKYDPAHPGVREGYIYIRHEPIQVPYGVIVPKKVDGLLVPVACSATHVGYQTIRMEPVFMQLGQAAATAAHLALARGTEVRALPPGPLQRELARAGCVITYYADLKPADPGFAAFQFLGTGGLNPGYTATPTRKLTRAEAAKKLGRICAYSNIRWAPRTDEPDTPLTADALTSLLRSANLPAPNVAPGNPAGPTPIDLRTFAELVAASLYRQPPNPTP